MKYIKNTIGLLGLVGLVVKLLFSPTHADVCDRLDLPDRSFTVGKLYQAITAHYTETHQALSGLDNNTELYTLKQISIFLCSVLEDKNRTELQKDRDIARFIYGMRRQPSPPLAQIPNKDPSTVKLESSLSCSLLDAFSKAESLDIHHAEARKLYDRYYRLPQDPNKEGSRCSYYQFTATPECEQIKDDFANLIKEICSNGLDQGQCPYIRFHQGVITKDTYMNFKLSSKDISPEIFSSLDTKAFLNKDQPIVDCWKQVTVIQNTSNQAGAGITPPQ